jgi:hypothetical protein
LVERHGSKNGEIGLSMPHALGRRWGSLRIVGHRFGEAL